MQRQIINPHFADEHPRNEAPVRSNSDEINRLILGLEEIEEDGGDALIDLSDSLRSLFQNRGLFDSLTLSDCKRKSAEIENELEIENETETDNGNENDDIENEEKSSDLPHIADTVRVQENTAQNPLRRRGVRRGYAQETSTTTTIPTKTIDGHASTNVQIRRESSVRNPNQIVSRAA